MRYCLGGQQSVARCFEGHHLPMASGQTGCRRVAVIHVHDHPDDVAVAQIVAWGRAGAANRVEEGAVHHHGHLGLPTAQCRHLDLQLRHEALGARGAPVGPANGVGKPNWFAVSKALELGAHSFSREVDRLHFKAVPTHGLVRCAGDDHVDLPSWLARLGASHEGDLGCHLRFGLVEADDLRKPSRWQAVLLESVWADDHGRSDALTQSAVRTPLVAPNRTDAAMLGATRARRPKRTHRHIVGVAQCDTGTVAALGGGQRRQADAVPFEYAEPLVGHSHCAWLNTRRRVVTSSGSGAIAVILCSQAGASIGGGLPQPATASRAASRVSPRSICKTVRSR